jgi:uncharacterized protein
VNATNVDIVTRFGAALHDERLDDACVLLHDDFVVHEAGGLPYSGDYHGPEGFRHLLSVMAEVFELTPGPIDRQSLADGTVVAQFRLLFAHRASGDRVEMSLVELYRLQHGRIIELDVFYKDPSAVTALWPTKGR